MTQIYTNFLNYHIEAMFCILIHGNGSKLQILPEILSHHSFSHHILKCATILFPKNLVNSSFPVSPIFLQSP
jgi:hypothetical protein